MESFCFKEFKVRQSHSAMKVNTDGVLLGAWLSLPHDGYGYKDADLVKPINDYCTRGRFRVLDVGTGTGVVALIIAQRLSKNGKFSKLDSSISSESFSFSIDAIDIDKPSVDEANYNFSQSPWAEQMNVKEISLQNFLKENLLTEKETNGNLLVEKYDLIVSNPPYFIDSLKAPCKRRSSARHNDDLPYEVIIEAAVKMLKDEGKLAIVLPAEEGEKFINNTTGAIVTTLQLRRRCRVKTLIDKKEKRYLLEFVKSQQPCNMVEEVLIMQETGGLEYTKQYKNLTKDFYLNF